MKRIFLLLSIVIWSASLAVAQTAVPMPNRSKLPSAHIRVLFQDSEGYMWYGMKGAGLCRDDGYGLVEFRADFRHPDITMDMNIMGIVEDGRGRLWIGTKRGLYILDKKDYTIHPTGDDVLQTWTIKGLQYCGGDTVKAWANNQVLVYDADGKCVSRIPAEENPLVSPNRKKVVDQRGNVWEQDGDGMVSVTRRVQMELKEVMMDTLKLEGFVPNKLLSMPETENVHTAWIGADGTKWACTSMGLWRMAPDSPNGVPEQVGPNFGVVHSMAIDDDGTAYVNTEHQGLVIYKDDRVAVLDSTIRNAVCMNVDDGKLWISTTDGRLFLYDPATKQKDDRSMECGLRGDPPLSMVMMNGNVWLLLNQRLLIYSPKDRSVQYYYASDLDPQQAFFWNIYSDGKDRAYVDSKTGWYEMILREDAKKDLPPTTIALSAYQTKYGIRYPGMGTNRLELEADERVVHLYFTTFNHMGTKQTRFAFKREGMEDWTYMNYDDNELALTQLKAGDQKLEVMVTDDNGQWSKNVFTLTIHCKPFWWETGWAIAGYIVLAVLLLGGTFWLGKKSK